MVIAVILVIIFILAAYFIYKKVALSLNRKKFSKRMLQFHGEWDQKLALEFGIYRTLSEEKKKVLLKLISIFIAEKNWSESIDETEKLIIAAQACAPVINRKTNLYPTIQKVEKNMDQNFWFNLNYIQFEFELGKMAAFKTKDRFDKLSHQYFYEREALQTAEPELFSYLDIYYNLKK